MGLLMRYLSAILAACLTSCLPGYVPPRELAPRQSTRIAAPFDATWNAVVTYLSEHRMEIKPLEKASGILVAEAKHALLLDNRPPVKGARGWAGGSSGPTPPARLAECGSYRKEALEPDFLAFNIRVTSESNASTVRANAQFATHYLEGDYLVERDCESVGALEKLFEDAVKKSAEHR